MLRRAEVEAGIVSVAERGIDNPRLNRVEATPRGFNRGGRGGKVGFFSSVAGEIEIAEKLVILCFAEFRTCTFAECLTEMRLSLTTFFTAMLVGFEALLESAAVEISKH